MNKKNLEKRSKKIQVNRETLRTLTEDDYRKVEGGERILTITGGGPPYCPLCPCSTN